MSRVLAPRPLEDPVETRAYVAENERKEAARRAILLAEGERSATCHGCGVIEGETHELGCDMEVCPWCARRLVACGCAFRVAGAGRAADLTEAQYDLLERLLEERGRVPWIFWPDPCALCGFEGNLPMPWEARPAGWDRYVPIDRRHERLCQDCYDRIVEVIDERSGGL